MPSRRQFLATSGAVGVGTLAGCLGGPAPNYAGGSADAPDTEWWPQPEFDRIASCYNPRPVGPREGVTERWSVDISYPAARPVVADGTAYLPTATALRAVDAATGAEQWTEDGGSDQPWPRRVVWHDGTVYVAQVGEPALLALDGETGEREWTRTLSDAGLRALLLDPERPVLYAGDDRGTVYRFDAATGDQHWRQSVLGPVVAIARSVPDLFVATGANEVHSLLWENGRQVGRRKLPGPVESLATANGRDAFLSVSGGPTFEVGGRNFDVQWRQGTWSADSFVVSGGTLVAAGDRLSALDIRPGGEQGNRRWTGGQTGRCGPAATGETIYAAADDRVVAYEFGGGFGVGDLRVDAKRWSHPVTGRPREGLAVADGAVFLLTEGGEGESSKAYALEAT